MSPSVSSHYAMETEEIPTLGAPIAMDGEDEDAFCRQMGQVGSYPKYLGLLSAHFISPGQRQHTFQAPILGRSRVLSRVVLVTTKLEIRGHSDRTGYRITCPLFGARGFAEVGREREAVAFGSQGSYALHSCQKGWLEKIQARWTADVDGVGDSTAPPLSRVRMPSN